MPSHEPDRARAAEAIVWDYETDYMPPEMDVVEREDLLMWRRRQGPAAQRRWANRVGFVRTTAADVDRMLEEILMFFGHLPFTWVVGPSSRPADLAERLSAWGLVDIGDGNLLTAALPIEGLRGAPDVDVVEVNTEELARIGVRLAHPNAPDAEMAELVAERLAYLAHPTRRGGFLAAFIGGEPVANAGYRYSSDGSTVFLSGAETVERFRRRGVYQSLVAYRAVAALKRGCRYAAIRARRDTSLPILAKRGFVDHGHLPIFAWPAA